MKDMDTPIYLALNMSKVVNNQESFDLMHKVGPRVCITTATHPGIWGTAALYAAAGLVGFTRMYVGAHYPRDVLGGAVLGSVWGILVRLVDPYWFGRF